eukprot:2192495-Rhodomonas_salina.6
MMSVIVMVHRMMTVGIVGGCCRVRDSEESTGGRGGVESGATPAGRVQGHRQRVRPGARLMFDDGMQTHDPTRMERYARVEVCTPSESKSASESHAVVLPRKTFSVLSHGFFSHELPHTVSLARSLSRARALSLSPTVQLRLFQRV